MDGDLFLVLGWGSPVGLGIFLIAKADKVSKHTKAFQKEQGLEKKSVVREKLGSSDK